MKKLIVAFVICSIAACDPANKLRNPPVPDNTLSLKEKNDGWQLLFNGNTTTGWHTYNKTGIGNAWVISDNALHLDAAAKKQSNAVGGDIVTDETYSNFHFKYDWKIAKNGNSGIMFYVQEDTAYKYSYVTGPEMQVVDNDGHPDAKNIKHRAADLYDLVSAKETVYPAEQWNRAEIISNKGDLKFFLNGEQVLHTTMWDENWKQLIANSKFKAAKAFGIFKTGKIALQDHGDDVWFRNLKIKRL
jgi:hypothetical protein